MSFSKEQKQFYIPRQANIVNNFEALCTEENLKHRFKKKKKKG